MRDREQSKKVSLKLMDRDRKTLRWANGFGCVTVEQVAKQNEVGYRNAARRVAAMCEAKFLTRIELAISKRLPLVCTRLGCAVARDSLPPLSGVRIGTLEHDLRVVDVARALTKRLGGTFEPARRVGLRREELGLEHLPDGILHRPNCAPVFIELELSLKSPQRLQKIIDGYGTNLSIKAVWYLVEDAAIGRAIQKAAAG